MRASQVAFAVAATVVIGVVPQVWIDPTALKIPATIGFLANALTNIAIGAVVRVPVALRGGVAGKLLLWAAALVTLLLGLALLDAADAFIGHPGMVLAAIALVGCAAGELGVAILCADAALRRVRSAPLRNDVHTAS